MREGMEEDEIDLLIESEYRRYQLNRLNSTSTAKKREVLKENSQASNQPEISFGKVKEMGRVQENLSRLIELMGCRSYQEALIKVDQMRKNERFIGAVLEMTRKCSPN
jgi:hypothetical protein